MLVAHRGGRGCVQAPFRPSNLQEGRPLMDVAVVTGASSGIGAATARELATAGFEVVLVARDRARADIVAAGIREAGGRAHVHIADLVDGMDVEGVVPAVLRLTAGRLHVLVNCAGVVGGTSVDTPPSIVDEMLQVNLAAPIQLMRHVVPHLVEQRRGAIVNVGSMAGELGVRGIYSASKFGLRGITYSVRRELRGSGVHVVLVEPGRVVHSETSGGSSPSAVARAIRASLSRRSRRRVLVPRTGLFVVALEAWMPGLIDRANAGVWRRSED